METPLHVPLFVGVMWATYFAIRPFVRKAELEELRRVATGEQRYVSEALALVMAQERARDATVCVYIGASVGLGVTALLNWMIG